MKKLWVFGCSVSELYDTETSITHWASKEYTDWKGYIPKCYSEILAEKMGYDLENHAVSATCNDQIFQDFCDCIPYIKEDDFVIIQWTEPNRFRLVNDEENWKSFLFNSKWIKHHLKKFSHIQYNTIQETLTNRLSFQYRKQLTSWEKLIKSKNHNVFIWYPFDKTDYGKLVSSVETIKDDTLGLIDDLHFSEKGQVDIANILFDKINNKSKNII